MLLRDFFDSIYTPKRLRGKSQNSIRLYRLCIRQFEKTIGMPPNVSDLTETNVLRHLARRCNVAPATRNKELAELKAMWRLASQLGMLESWPDIMDEPEPERDPIAWMPSELNRLLDHLTRLQGNVGEIPAWLWWSGIVRVILDSGERVGAVLAMEWHWLQGEYLRVPAEARKGKTRDRTYQLNPQTLQILDLIRPYNRGRQILPYPKHKNYLWSEFRNHVADAGLPTGRKYQFHCLRKTVGSAVYAAGHDPQDALDHSDRRTTQRYLDPRATRKHTTCDILAAYLQNPRRDDRQQGTG